MIKKLIFKFSYLFLIQWVGKKIAHYYLLANMYSAQTVVLWCSVCSSFITVFEWCKGHSQLHWLLFDPWKKYILVVLFSNDNHHQYFIELLIFQGKTFSFKILPLKEK